MIILSPSSKFRIRYEVAEGQPYSYLDQMILKAVAENCTSQESLAKIFHIHPRLIIQSLVTLTQAGWIALGSSSDRQFVITRIGKNALTDDKLPEFIEKSTKNSYVILDRVTGIVIPENQVPYTNKLLLQKRGRFDNRACLKMEFFDNKIDEGEIIHMLPRGKRQRLHWVGPIEMVTKGQEYILVDYDESKQQIMNLPSKLADALLPYVVIKIEELRFREEKDGVQISHEDWTAREFEDITYGARTELPNPLADYINFDWQLNDLIIGEVAHENLFYDALNQAKSIIYIASSGVSAQRIESLKDPIISALKRGVDIHILRGIKSDSESAQLVIEAAEKEMGLEYGKMITNRIAAQSNVRFALWDNSDGTFTAVVGSYDWLNQSQAQNDVGVHIKNQLLVAYLARHAAGLWVGTRGESLSSIPDRWRRIATGIENSVDLISEFASNKEVKAKFFFTQEHYALRYKWIQQNKSNLVIASPVMTDLITPILQKRKPVEGEELPDAKLYYDEMPEKYRDDFLLSNRATRIKDLSGRFIISDDKVCISSFNFLANQFERKQNVRELGLTIIGGGIGDQLREKILENLNMKA